MADLPPPPPPPPPPPALPEAPANGAAPEHPLVPGPGSKRQRRPSVRLGDLGEQSVAIPYEPYVRRSKQWRPLHFSSSSPDPRLHHPPLPHKDHLAAPRLPSKSRPLTNLPPPDDPRDAPPEFPLPPPPTDDGALVPVDENLEPLAAAIRRGSRDIKSRRGGGAASASASARRIRSGWTLKADEVVEGADLKSSGGEDAGDNGYGEGSESPSNRRAAAAAAAVVRARVSEEPPATDMVEGDAPSETDGGDWNNNHNGRCRSPEEGGVRFWLNQLGLSRYAPVFEIHEVDDEVLPMLTLEDLKDMGINAVGSRRKMYCAIQKLKKRFT